jgi:hypothetical protein
MGKIMSSDFTFHYWQVEITGGSGSDYYSVIQTTYSFVDNAMFCIYLREDTHEIVLIRLNKSTGALELAVGLDFPTFWSLADPSHFVITSLMFSISKMYYVGSADVPSITGRKAFLIVSANNSGLETGNCLTSTAYAAGVEPYTTFTDLTGAEITESTVTANIATSTLTN